MSRSNVTGPSAREAKRHRLDTDNKLTALFNHYKDPNGDHISIEGTVRLCQDLGVDLEDIVLLAVAYELQSPRIGVWNIEGWLEGWRHLSCDTIEAMRTKLPHLRKKLGKDHAYFREVYVHTFTLALSDGQRSLPTEIALDYWELLLPFGLAGSALKHESSSDGEDVNMDGDKGWQHQHTQWWLEFMRKKGSKGVSKDTWQMLRDFIRSIDSKFATHDATASWPSTIDDFVEWVQREKKAELERM